MKKKFFNSINYRVALSIFIFLIFVMSCKKYNSLGFTPGTGVPTIASVHTWSKTDTSVYYDTVITYDASGNAVKTPVAKSNRVTPFDSITTAGNLSNYYIIYGANLGTTTSVTFNGLSAYFNRALITDKSIVIQVPAKTPYLKPLATDSLVITTLYGKAYYKFAILPPPPSPASYSNYNFSAGSQITLTGVGFAAVTGVTLSSTSPAVGGTANVSIISQNDTVVVLQFPSTTVPRGVLNFAYTSNGATKTQIDTQDLIDLDNAYQIFTEGYAPSWGSWSWGTAGPSTSQAKSGTTSFAAAYGANSWWIDGFRAGGGGATDGLAYSADYKYLSFWVFGGVADEKIYVEFGNTGFNQNQTAANQYDVPPGVWTYFKIPIANIIWNNSGTTNWAANTSQYLNTVAFFMNSNTVAEQLYFDDVVLVK